MAFTVILPYLILSYLHVVSKLQHCPGDGKLVLGERGGAAGPPLSSETAQSLPPVAD